MFTLFLASKSMQEGWGSGGDDMSLGPSQWEDEEGAMWNSAASQESASSCSSWGNAPKKGLQKVCVTLKKDPESVLLLSPFGLVVASLTSEGRQARGPRSTGP